MAKDTEAWKRLADSLVADLSPETIKQMAEAQLQAAMDSYDVQNTIRDALKEPVKDAVEKVAKSSEFRALLYNTVEKHVLTLIEPAVSHAMYELMKALRLEKN